MGEINSVFYKQLSLAVPGARRVYFNRTCNARAFAAHLKHRLKG